MVVINFIEFIVYHLKCSCSPLKLDSIFMTKIPNNYYGKDKKELSHIQGKASLFIEHHSDTMQFKVFHRGIGNTLGIKEKIKIKI